MGMAEEMRNRSKFSPLNRLVFVNTPTIPRATRNNSGKVLPSRRLPLRPTIEANDPAVLEKLREDEEETMSRKIRDCFVLMFVISTIIAYCGNSKAADLKDCSSSIGSRKTVNGQPIGPKTCMITSEHPITNVHGVPYRRIEIGISGSIEGYTPIEPSRVSGYFSDVPEFAIAQRGDLGPYAHGILNYVAEKGTGITLFIPERAADWNGKLYVLAHGSGQYPPIGELLPRKPDQFNPFTGRNSYAGLMIDKGYAVAYTRRSGTKFGGKPGTETVTFDDGKTAGEKAFDYHVGFLRDCAFLAQNMIQSRLGRKPSRTYWWGHSAGAALGHLMNYAPGANIDGSGKRIFDGFLDDDPGGGLYLPAIQFVRTGDQSHMSFKVDVKDHLVFNENHKRNFGYQIDIIHQAYAGNDYVLGDYLTNKRQNARILIAKGLKDKIRTYEIVGVSHADAGGVYPSPRASQNLDLSGFYNAIIDVLDKWVEAGIEPPPTRSDAYDLGDINKDGLNENPAIELPEIACPLGVYYEFAEGLKNPGQTGFAAYLREPHQALNSNTEPIPADYDKAWLEPLDSRGYFLDMNKNGVRDTRDSIAQAWRRRMAGGEKYGTLGFNETLTHARYVSCVTAVATDLAKQHLLSEVAPADYIKKASASDVGNSPSEAEQYLAVPVGKKPAN